MFLVCTYLHIAIPFIFWLLHVLQISISGKVVYASEDKIFHKDRPTVLVFFTSHHGKYN